MKFRLLTFFSLFLSISASAQLSNTINTQGTQCFGDSNGSITIDSIMGCYAPISILAGSDTVTANHLSHEGFSNITHLNGNGGLNVLSVWAGNAGSTTIYAACGTMEDTTMVSGTMINPTSDSIAVNDGFIAVFDQNTNTMLWSKVIGDSNAGANSQGYKVTAITSDGTYLYAVGESNDTVNFDTTNIWFSGQATLRTFVAKMSLLTGAIDTVFMIQSAGPGLNAPSDVNIQNGKVYITGDYQADSVNLAGTLYPNTGAKDIYVLCVDADMNTQYWGATANGAGDENPRKIFANDVAGVTDQIIVSAQITFTSTWGVNTLTPSGNFDVAYAALDTNGNWLWSFSFGDDNAEAETSGLDFNDAGDRFYLSGYFGDTVTISGQDFISNGLADGFIGSFDLTGTLQNLYQFGGGGAEQVTSVSHVKDEYVLFTGNIESALLFADSTYNSSAPTNPFIGKVRLDSHEVYGVHFEVTGGALTSSFNDIDHNEGRVIAGGFFQGDASATQAGLIATNSFDGMITNMNIMAMVDTTIMINNLSAGSYTVTMLDSAGNVLIDTVSVLSPSQIVMSAIVGGASSSTASDGFVDLTVTGGTPTYLYNWSNAAITEDISSLAYGWYTVTISDANGCSAIDSFYVDSIYVAIPMSSSGVVINELCYSDSNGAIDLTVQYGSPAYSYLWNTGDTIEDLTNLTQGTYFVTITDTSGNTLLDTFVVSGNPQIVLSGTQTPATNSTSLDGGYDLIVSGGSTPFSFVWSNAAITGVLAGAYSVTVTDSAGCSETLAINIDSLSGPVIPLIVTSTVTDELCFGDNNGAIDISVTGGVAPYTYVWNLGDTTQDLTNIPAGTYFVTVTDSDTSSTTDSIVVGGNPEIVITSILTPPTSGSATDGALDVSVSGGTAPYSYLWSNAMTTEDIMNLGVGSYSITVTDALGCFASNTFAVDTIPALSLVSISSDVTCLETNNGAIDLTIIGGLAPFTIAWSNGATTEDLIGLATGSYTVTVTDSFGQVKVLTDSVSSNPSFPNPTVGPITGSASVQSWNSYTYTVPLSNGSAFNWTVNGGLINNTASNAASVQWNAGPDGALYITETDANGCIGYDSLAVTVIFLGVSETHENTIQVYPNPSNGQVTINLPEAFSTAKLSVISLSGTLVHEQQIEGLNSFVSLGGVSKGTYIMQFENEGIILHHKVILQ
jgi:hypothetical protein